MTSNWRILIPLWSIPLATQPPQAHNDADDSTDERHALMTTVPAPTTAVTGAEARRAARNAGAVAVARILSSGVLFLWQITLAPWLGTGDYGIYSTVMALYAIGVPLASFSMGMMMIRDLARAPELAGRYLSAALVMQTVLTLLAYIGINLGGVVLDYEPTVRAFVGLAGLSLFVDLVGNLCYDQLLAREKIVVTSTVDVLHILVRIGLTALALTAGLGLPGVYVATIITGTARSILLWMTLRGTGVRPEWPLDRALASTLFFNSVPLALSAFLVMTYQHIDKLMISNMMTTNDTAYLGVAFVIIYGVVEIFSTTILIAVYPLMARVYATQQALFAFIVQKLAFFSLTINLFTGLVLTLFAADLTVPIFGEDFRPAAAVLRILIWYAVVMMVGNVFTRGFLVQNQQRGLLFLRAAGLAVNIGMNLILIPRLGILGAAVSSTVAECCFVGLMIVRFRAADWRWQAGLPRLARLMIVAAVTGTVMAFVGQIHPILGIVVGAAVYFAGVTLGGTLAEDDLDLIYRLLSAMPGGALVRRVWHRPVTLNG